MQALDVRTDPDGRYVILYARIYDRTIVLVEIYLPPPAFVQVLYMIMQLLLMMQMIVYD